jgi:hypothetical protein
VQGLVSTDGGSTWSNISGEFLAEANTDRFLQALPAYVRHGVQAFTLNLQGGMPGYEGAVNSAFDAEGNLKTAHLQRRYQSGPVEKNPAQRVTKGRIVCL